MLTSALVVNVEEVNECEEVFKAPPPAQVIVEASLLPACQHPDPAPGLYSQHPQTARMLIKSLNIYRSCRSKTSSKSFTAQVYCPEWWGCMLQDIWQCFAVKTNYLKLP